MKSCDEITQQKLIWHQSKWTLLSLEQSKQLKFLFRITLMLTGQKQPVANKNRCP